MLNEKEFYDKLDSFLKEMKKVKSASSYYDCCERSCRSRNVFVIPSRFKDDFLKFLDDSQLPNSLKPDYMEDREYPNSYSLIRFSEGAYRDLGTYCDYDGFLECDREGMELKCIGWTICSFSSAHRSFQEVWRTYGIHDYKTEEWVRIDEPIVRGELTRYWKSGDAWTSSKWVCDENVICFMG